MIVVDKAVFVIDAAWPEKRVGAEIVGRAHRVASRYSVKEPSKTALNSYFKAAIAPENPLLTNGHACPERLSKETDPQLLDHPTHLVKGFYLCGTGSVLLGLGPYLFSCSSSDCTFWLRAKSRRGSAGSLSSRRSTPFR